MDDDTNIFGEEVSSILREDSLVRRIMSTFPESQEEHLGVGQISVDTGILQAPTQHIDNVMNRHQPHQPQQQNYHEDHSLSRPHNPWEHFDSYLDHASSENSNYSYADNKPSDTRVGIGQQEQQNLPIPYQQELQVRLQSQQLQNLPGIWNTVLFTNAEQSPTVREAIPQQNIVPCLQPWRGMHEFNISVTTVNNNKKWCYSPLTKKLYMCPSLSVPVDVSVYNQCDALIRITPVYRQSQHFSVPVVRCYNCKSTNDCDSSKVEHIVQLEGEECRYETIQGRYVVTLPLNPPPPGENTTTLLIKMMCLTSDVGGPNRRPFCLVFTLLCSVTGREIGRQILDIKCSKCPNRDRQKEEMIASQNEYTNSNTTQDDEKTNKIGKLASKIKVGQKRKRSALEMMDYVTKIEPGTEPVFVNVPVPVQFEKEVKRYVNRLMAMEMVKRSQPHYLLYPEEEEDS